MTVPRLAEDGPLPAAARRSAWGWQPAGVVGLGCASDHPASPGRLEETARRLSHEEFAVARQFAREGHDVQALATRPGQGRTADLLVCGTPVEVKSWLTRADRSGTGPVARSVVNKLLQAEGQAATVVLYGRGSGLSPAAARAGVAVYAGLPHRGNVAAVRVIGDGFDLSWTRVPRVEQERLATRRAPSARRGPDLEVSL